MSIPPRRGPPRLHRTLGLAAVAAATVFLLTLVAVSPAGAGVPRAALSQSLTAAGCSGWVSNSSLVATVNQHYPNASLAPTEPVADGNVVTAWGTVCGSTPFLAATTLGSHLAFSYSIQAADKNTTANRTIVGSLFATFTLGWTAACPAGAYPAGYPCDFNDSWNANLTTLAIAGPASTVASQRLAQCDTPAQNESDVYMLGEFYAYPPTSGNTSPTGVNYTAPEPNESVADAELATIWGAVCSSSAYYDVLVAHPTNEPSTSAWVGGGAAGGGGGGTWSGTTAAIGSRLVPGANNSPGNGLSFEWSLGWDDACPSNMTGYTNGSTCYFSENWIADLASDSYVGPVAQVATGSGPPPLGSGQNPATGTPAASSGQPIWASPFVWVAAVAAAAAVLGAAAFVHRGRRRHSR